MKSYKKPRLRIEYVVSQSLMQESFPIYKDKNTEEQLSKHGYTDYWKDDSEE